MGIYLLQSTQQTHSQTHQKEMNMKEDENLQSIVVLGDFVAELLVKQVPDPDDWSEAPTMMTDLHMPLVARRVFDEVYQDGELKTEAGVKLSQGVFERELISLYFVHGVALRAMIAPILRLGGHEAQDKFILSVSSLACAMLTELSKKNAETV